MSLVGLPKYASARKPARAAAPDDALLAFAVEKSADTSTPRPAPSVANPKGAAPAAHRVHGHCDGPARSWGCGCRVNFALTRTNGARSVPAPLDSGTAVFDSNPPGSVTIEGVVRGQTPLSLRLPAGSTTSLIPPARPRAPFLLEIEAGATTRQYIEFAATRRGRRRQDGST